MRRRFLTGVGLIAGFGALAVAGTSTGVAAKSAATKTKFHCTGTSYNVSYPQLSGLAFGVLSCSKPFGAGVQKATTKASVVGSAVNVTGAFTNFFDGGTQHGTIKLSGTFGPGAITGSGSARVTGGTGAYRHMKGTGKATCTTTDAGKTYHCTIKGTATL